tara:strand:+ start:57 stop:512 length:456 start_codon:yes stop_codon:yes gene_type:complete
MKLNLLKKYAALDFSNNDIKTLKALKPSIYPLQPMKADGDYEFIKELDYDDIILTDTYYNDKDDFYSNAKVKWDAAIETRSYGIKDVHFYTVQVQLEVFNSETDELIEVIDTEVDDSWETSDENSHIELGSTIHPRSIEVNQVDKIIYINW